MSLNLNDTYAAIIFDVDGTLVTTKSGETFRKTADDWEMLPGRIRKCTELRSQCIRFALASNQAGVAFPWSKFTAGEIKQELDKVARYIGASLVSVCYTTPNAKALPEYHNPNDPRRKPGPGMINEILEEWQVAPEYVLFVGDRDEDEQAAKAAGVAFIHADTFFA